MSSEAARSLNDFVSLQRGTTYKGNLVGLPGPVLLGLASIQPNGGFRYGGFKTYGGECPEKISLSPGDLYVSLKDVTQSGDLLGSVARIPPDIESGRLTQDTVKLIFDGAPISKEYIYWLLRTPSYREYCRGCATGTTTLGLARDDFLSFPVHAPRAADNLLVDVLEGIEKRITLLHETNATLEAIAQALFKSWFVDFDPVRARQEGRIPEGMDEEAAALFPDSFEESELGLVPKGWKVAKFGDFINRLSVGKKYDQKSALPEGNIPILDQGKSGIIGFHDNQPGVEASLDKPVVVFANHTCYMRLIPFSFSAIQNVLPFIGDGVDTVWAFYATKDRVAFSEYKGHWPEFAIEKTVLPPSRLTEIYREKVDLMIRRMRLNDVQAQTLTTIRDTLLPRLISGQLRLPDIEQVTDYNPISATA